MVSRWLNKRTLFVVLLIGIVLAGAGAGILNQLQGPNSEMPGSEAENTPGTPTVSVTPSDSEAPDNEIQTGSGDHSATEIPDSETERGESTATPTTKLQATVNLDAAAPTNVENYGGTVGPLWGSLSGTVQWEGAVDTAVVVVSTWSPGDGWIERQRVTTAVDGDSISFEDLFDQRRYLYLTADQASAFSNPHEGTTRTRTGYVGATVVLFDNGTKQARVVGTDDYSFDVTNAGEVDISINDSEGVIGTTTTASNAAPGSSGNRSISVENSGAADGTVRVLLRNVSGSENGIAAPEAAAGENGPKSELLKEIKIRIRVSDNTDSEYLLGGPDEYVSLDGVSGILSSETVGSFNLPVGETRAVVVEWTVPESAGNELMTDTADWDLVFVLESDGT